jgi:beta-glucanase (GH16 family)
MRVLKHAPFSRRDALLALAALLGAVALGVPLSSRGSDGVLRGAGRESSAGLRLIWSEDFNGPAGSAPSARRWNYDVGGGRWGNEELEYYTSRRANAALDGRGHLVLTARAGRYTGPDGVTRRYTSARLQTLHKLQFQYGRVEARIKVPGAPGLRPAFWMLGNDAYQPHGWPQSGEIDTMEVLCSQPDVVKGTLHGPWPWAPHGVGSSMRAKGPLASSFHDYGVLWEPERISFLLDGSVYDTITPADLPAGAAWPFRHPFILLLDLAVGGVATGTPDPAALPARMLVDWVRVWQ